MDSAGVCVAFGILVIGIPEGWAFRDGWLGGTQSEDFHLELRVDYHSG